MKTILRLIVKKGCWQLLKCTVIFSNGKGRGFAHTQARQEKAVFGRLAAEVQWKGRVFALDGVKAPDALALYAGEGWKVRG